MFGDVVLQKLVMATTTNLRHFFQLSSQKDYTSDSGVHLDSRSDLQIVDLSQPQPFWLRFAGRWGNDKCGNPEPTIKLLSGKEVYALESGPTGPLY